MLPIEVLADTLIVTPSPYSGSLADSELQSFWQSVADRWQEGDLRGILVDLRRTAVLGAATLGHLVKLGADVRAGKGTMALCHVSPIAGRVLASAGLERRWPTYGSRREALRDSAPKRSLTGPGGSVGLL